MMCSADCNSCAPCQRANATRRLGAMLSFDPADIASRFAPIVGLPPDVIKAGVNTAVGLSTPVSAADAQAFAHLAGLAARLQTIAFSPDTPAEQAKFMKDALREYGAFTRAWNAAQRDPDKLRALIATFEAALSASAEEGAASARVQLRHIHPRGFVRRHALPLAVGGALVLAGGAIAVLR